MPGKSQKAKRGGKTPKGNKYSDCSRVKEVTAEIARRSGGGEAETLDRVRRAEGRGRIDRRYYRQPNAIEAYEFGRTEYPKEYRTGEFIF